MPIVAVTVPAGGPTGPVGGIRHPDRGRPGPLALAAHLLGLTDFLVALKTDPQATHRLMAVTTRTVKTWLEAQLEALPGGEGVMVLDDVMGFLSRDDYLEFAHPYLKEIFSLPVTLKILHNDNPSPVCYEFIHDLGVDVFNFSHQQGLNAARRLVGDQVCLMGNVPPLDVLVNGTAEETAARARDCIEENAGAGVIQCLSVGGVVSPGRRGRASRPSSTPRGGPR